MTQQESDELSAAFRDLLDEVAGIERKILGADPHSTSPMSSTVPADVQPAAGRRGHLRMWGDRDNPRFVDVTGPYQRWGGDNSDAFYQIAPVDPNRTYRVTGNRGDSGVPVDHRLRRPDDGHYSNPDRRHPQRPVAGVRRRRQPREFTISPDPQPGAWLKLEPDAVVALTRDYLENPETDRRVQWKIEAVDRPARRVETRADLARRMRAAKTFLADQVSFIPTRVEPPNEIAEPYPVPEQTFGWAAGDAAYAMGAYELRPDQALIIEGTSPPCVFWNLCLWNPWLHTYDYTYERVTINGAHITYEPDGSWRIVVSDTDPGHPNCVSPRDGARA